MYTTDLTLKRGASSCTSDFVELKKSILVDLVDAPSSKTQNTKNNPEDHDEKHSRCEWVLHCETYLLL
jgi:hypothetical protein